MNSTPDPTEPLDWRAWGRAEWSGRLFGHFFGAGETASAVAYVPATRFDLKRAVGDPDADPVEVERSFVRALTVSPHRIRELLSVRSPEFLESWQSTTAPGYFAHLVLTCYVAAGGDEETVTEGQFRERLRQTLGHPSGTTYDLSDLGLLWKAFAAWLRPRAAAGEARLLKLPDPGHMSRIGFSLRLAFPTLRDRRTLADALADLRGEVPSTREAFRRVRLTAFGDRSQVPDVLDDFARRLAAGGLDLQAHPFWTAVRDAVALDYGSPVSTNVPRVGLVVDEPAALDLSSLRVGVDYPEGPMPPVGVEFDRLPATVGGFEKSLCLDPGPDPVSALLSGRIASYWPVLGRTPLARAARQGAFVLARDEGYWPVSRASLPDPGLATWILARLPLLSRLLPFVTGDAPILSSGSAYDGWGWVGPVDAERLRHLADHFPDVDGFQSTVAPPPVRLGGGVRTGSSYLGVPGALPHVTAPTSVGVARTSSETVESVDFVRRGDGRFEDPALSPVQGDHLYVASDAQGGTVGYVHARFVGVHVGVEYVKPPSGNWLVEGALAEVEPWGGTDFSAGPGSCEGAPLESTTGDLDAAVLLEGGPTHPAPAPSLAANLGPFVEVVAARSVARAGLPEAEFLRLLVDVLGVPEGPVLWETARAWVESGHLDVLYPQAWPSRTYLARRPRLVAWDEDGGLHATLFGLAPAEVRARVAAHVSNVGGAVVERLPASPWVLDPVVVRVPSGDALAVLARHAELPEPTRLQSFASFASHPASVVSRVDVSPSNRHTRAGVWNWARGFFGQPGAEQPVVLSRWTHPRSPDRYLVEAVGTSRAFRSRTWAFLYALTLRGEAVWSVDPQGVLTTVGPTRAHLPVPVAQALACSGGAPGPRRTADGRVEYVRPTTPTSLAALSSWLGGRRAVPAEAASLARRLRARLESAPGVPIPMALATRFEPYAHDPDVAALLNSRFPAPLMPHVARLAAALTRQTP